jgi:hypothetical protein
MIDQHGHKSCFPIPPIGTVHAAFTAPGDRLSGHLPSFPLCRHWRGCPRLHIRHIRTLRHLISCGPSPCSWLSQPLSTMATLTADMDIGGFQDGFPTPSHSLSFPFHLSSPLFPMMHSARSCRWWLLPQPIPAYRGSRVDVNYTRPVHVILGVAMPMSGSSVGCLQQHSTSHQASS